MANATDQAALDWAKAILSGDYSSIPMYNELTDQQYADPTQNPYIQAMIGNIQDSLKQDWLGSQAALMDQAEAGGRFGSGLYQAQSAQNMGRTQQALAQAESQLYAQSYENERNRRAQIMADILGAQQGAAQIPIGFKNAKANMVGARASMKNARTNASANAFNQKMQTLQAQQGALTDYFNILGGIGGLGGTTYGTSPGTYIPSQNPIGAGLMTGSGTALQMYGLNKMYGGGGGGGRSNPLP